MTHHALHELPLLPEDKSGPVFNEPWEAHAFALALKLCERGVFTWKEWATALAAEIESAQAGGDPDLGDTYYQHWLNALEKLVNQKGIADPLSLGQRKGEWRKAYLNTPHGQPVHLDAAFGKRGHTHLHE